MNVRGWEQSTRPASLNEPPEENPPAVSSEQAVHDISAVVDWVGQQNQSSKVALLGWATGGHWAGIYTSRNNDKVSHLIMLNSLYGVDAPWELNQAFEDPNRSGQFDANSGAYRLVNAEGLISKWNETIPVEDKSQWREEAVAKAYRQNALTSDPTSYDREPPSLLMFKVFKPRRTLKESDSYKTKIKLASSIITELIELGFQIELVLADSLYGEASSFIRTLEKYQLPWVVAIRSNHGVWLTAEQRVRANKWCKFKRTFSNQTSETRYIREIIYGKRNKRTYWEITTDPKLCQKIRLLL